MQVDCILCVYRRPARAEFWTARIDALAKGLCGLCWSMPCLRHSSSGPIAVTRCKSLASNWGLLMSTWSALLLGFGLGLRHATDADHVVVVSTLVQQSPGLKTAARIAALWGLGHTTTFLCLGLPLICFGLRRGPIPASPSSLSTTQHHARSLRSSPAGRCWRVGHRTAPSPSGIRCGHGLPCGSGIWTRKSRRWPGTHQVNS